TGVVITNATAKPPSSANQKSASDSCASIAPGVSAMITLSTSSITAMETVSAASATLTAAFRDTPARTTANRVKEYPKTKARAMASTIVGTLPHNSDVPMTMPRISPRAHPVRQCSVAFTAIAQVAPCACPLSECCVTWSMPLIPDPRAVRTACTARAVRGRAVPRGPQSGTIYPLGVFHLLSHDPADRVRGAVHEGGHRSEGHVLRPGLDTGVRPGRCHA